MDIDRDAPATALGEIQIAAPQETVWAVGPPGAVVGIVGGCLLFGGAVGDAIIDVEPIDPTSVGL